MAYNPTVWEENDLLSADRMNKIEQGIVSAFEAASESGGIDIATIENETIQTPDQVSQLLGTDNPNCCVYLKSTTIKDIEFENEIVFICQYQDGFETKTDVYTQTGKKYSFVFDDFMDSNNFYEVKESSFTFEAPTKKEVVGLINDLENESVLYSSIDKFFEIYGIEGQSVTVAATLSYGTKTKQVSKDETVKTVVDYLNQNSDSYKYFYKKSTGEILEKNISNNSTNVVQLKVNNEVITPTPTTTSFVTSGGAVSKITVLTESEYEALTAKDATTLYLVKEEA